MIYISERNVVNSNVFVREPVDKEVNSILSSKSNKIILSGELGTGRSIVLQSLENRGLGDKTQTIRISPDSVGSVRKLSDDILDHRIELIFTRSLIFYVQRYYHVLFEKYLRPELDSINGELHLYDEYMNNSLFDFDNSLELKNKFKTKDLSSSVLVKIRDILELEKLNLAIDNFDSISNSSEYLQRVYSRYFDLFDKIILVSKDPNLDKERLTKEGYDIRTLNYGMDKDILGEIIKRRIEFHNHSCANQYDVDFCTQHMFIEGLAERTPSISLSLYVITEIEKLRKWYRDSNVSSERIYEEATTKEEKNFQDLKKIMSPRKFYI